MFQLNSPGIHARENEYLIKWTLVLKDFGLKPIPHILFYPKLKLGAIEFMTIITNYGIYAGVI